MLAKVKTWWPSAAAVVGAFATFLLPSVTSYVAAHPHAAIAASLVSFVAAHWSPSPVQKS